MNNSDDFAQLANDLRIACQRIARRVRFEGTGPVAPHQFSVLAKTTDAGLTPTALAEAERVSTPSMTRTVNGLVERGLVERLPHPDDGRQVVVCATAEGRELVARVMADRDTWMARHLDGLSDDDLAALRRATDILLEVAARD